MLVINKVTGSKVCDPRLHSLTTKTGSDLVVVVVVVVVVYMCTVVVEPVC